MQNDLVLQGLIEAIKAEVEGHNFYMMAAHATQDQHGKQIFERLAKEELEHVGFLRMQYNSFLNTNHPDLNVKLNKSGFSMNSPIFSDSIKARIHSAHFEMTALSVGIQLELSAVRFYQEQAGKMKDVVAQKFYQELADWESTHYNMLLHQQESLKQSYWQTNEFAPF